MATKKGERSYGLSTEEVKQLTEEYKATKKFPNPHRAGAYAYTVAALVNLGVNKPHSLTKVHEAFKKAAGNDWYRAWANKEARSEATGKNAAERFLQNIRVLQRTRDYARRLLEVGRRVMRTKGCVIDLTRDKQGNLLVTLNTNSSTPQKPDRVVERKPVTKPRKSARKAKTNGSGGPVEEPQQPQS